MRNYAAEVEEIHKNKMVEDTHYGKVSGIPKPMLFKPGAELLCQELGFHSVPVIVEKFEDWKEGIYHYVVQVTIYDTETGKVVGSGLGSCNSKEKRYWWRQKGRTCPNCQTDNIRRGRASYGGGWYCWEKAGGCGAKFNAGDQRIESQTNTTVKNEDIADSANTVLKMARKRGFVDGVLTATSSSDRFGQDLEDDLPAEDNQPAQTSSAPAQTAAQPAAQAGQQAKIVGNLKVTVANIEGALTVKMLDTVKQSVKKYAWSAGDMSTIVKKVKEREEALANPTEEAPVEPATPAPEGVSDLAVEQASLVTACDTVEEIESFDAAIKDMFQGGDLEYVLAQSKERRTVIEGA